MEWHCGSTLVGLSSITQWMPRDRLICWRICTSICICLRWCWYCALHVGWCTAPFCNNNTGITFQCIFWMSHQTRWEYWMAYKKSRHYTIGFLPLGIPGYLGMWIEAIIRDEWGQIPNELLVREVQNIQPRLEKMCSKC